MAARGRKGETRVENELPLIHGNLYIATIMLCTPALSVDGTYV